MLSYYKLLNFILSLLIFVVIVDPANVLFKAKEFFFFLLMGMYCYALIKKMEKIDLKMLNSIILLFFIFFFSFLYGHILGYDFDYEFTIGFLKSFLFFTSLLFFNVSNVPILKKLLFPCVIICLVTIIIYVSTCFWPEMERLFYSYFLDNDKMIMMSRRSFLGIDVTQVFYRTIPITIILLSYYYAVFLKERKKLYMIISLLFLIALLMSGTRANMLSAIMIVSLLTLWNFRKSQIGIICTNIVFIIFVVIISIVIYEMLTDVEDSVEIKSGHLVSLINLFNDNPLLLLGGQGAGSLYYTTGFGDFSVQSELTYIELIRMFGLLGGFFIILFFVYPLFLLFKNKPPYYGALFLGYLAYLFVGGTNPLLISSTGILVLMAAYSFSNIRCINNE